MKKTLSIFFFLLILGGCSYFQVKDAINLANNGNYIESLDALTNVLKDSPDDKRSIQAFNSIYPMAIKSYEKDTQNPDIILQTEGYLNLLKTYGYYYMLPTSTKNFIILPRTNESEVENVKRNLSQNFYNIGKNIKGNSYATNLEKFGYLASAQEYNVDVREDIQKDFLQAKNSAQGKFLLNVSSANPYFTSAFKENLQYTLQKYPFFTLANGKDYNLELDVNISNLRYIPPKVYSQSGVDSYTESVPRRVYEKRTEVKEEKGQKTTTEKWIPIDTFEDVEIRYRYTKYEKVSAVEFDLGYRISEKNGNIISIKKEKIRYEDVVNWTEYYPLNWHKALKYGGIPMSEREKPSLGEYDMQNLALEAGVKRIDEELERLDNHRKIKNQ